MEKLKRLLLSLKPSEKVQKSFFILLSIVAGLYLVFVPGKVSNFLIVGIGFVWLLQAGIEAYDFYKNHFKK